MVEVGVVVGVVVEVGVVVGVVVEVGVEINKGDYMSNDKVKPPHTERIFITAEMARKWLRENIEGNRKINQSRVSQYVRDIKAGKWAENGETVKFSDEGKLIDGQHRLTASVECGIGFWSLVAYGVSKDAFLTIDRNQPRSIGQQLHLAYGATDYNNLQAALTWLYRFRDGIVMASGRPTTHEIAELLEENPNMGESVKAAGFIHSRLRTPSRSTLAFCHYAMTRQDATLAEAFFDALATGASIRDVDPVFKLRERLIYSAAASAAKKISSYEFIALVFKAWLAEKEQRTMDGSLRWQVGESFPNIGPIGTKKRRLEAITLPVNMPKKKLGKGGMPMGKGNAHSPKDRKYSKDKKIERLINKPMSLDRV